MKDQSLKYPIGQYERPGLIRSIEIKNWIKTISLFPEMLKEQLITMNDELLDTPYRPNGWTVRQVVHHCADSHMNAYIRFKLALTEEKPIIKPYDEGLWSELRDSKFLPVEPSITLLTALHYRWCFVLKSIDEDTLKRKYVHPESGTEVSLSEAIGVYAWHCNHHLAHIKLVKNKSV
ncbi:YfiT family bacillithiol transferase [Roseivirga seohaensis]|uniref:YfiT family bacillithiol transferase n=1 Tax=Roseivirga seohaensis TaxID=1914963 RepID=UPI003BA946B0